MSISIIGSQTLTEISMSSSLRSVMYMLTVDCSVLTIRYLSPRSSSVKTNNSIVQTLVQNSFFFRGHLDLRLRKTVLTLTTFRYPILAPRCRESSVSCSSLK